MDEAAFITTAEAARRLGVKPATLYAYVSRGLLRAHRPSGQKQSLYERQEVEQLARSHSSARRESPNLLRFRAVVSRVSHLDENSLTLRDQPIEQLCGHVSFAQAARTVLARPNAPVITLRLPPTQQALVDALPLPRRLPVALALWGAADPQRASLDADRHAGLSLGLIDAAPALAGPALELSAPTVQALLVCLIDNGLAASTTAARVAASARAGWYDVQAAGLGALAGQLHGAAPEQAREVLRQLMRGEAADAVAAQWVDAVGHVPGFGHSVYRGDDPRARALRAVLARLGQGDAALDALARLQRTLQRPLNVDALSAVICEAHALPEQAGEFLFQLARSVGIAAHALEEYGEAPLRWRARGTV